MRKNTRSKYVLPEDIGSTRIVTKFLWWPKEINHERRWLEKCSWEEHVTERSFAVALQINRVNGLTGGGIPDVSPWLTVRWVDVSEIQEEVKDES